MGQILAKKTVKPHITRIFDKLGVYNGLELVFFAFHRDLIENKNGYGGVLPIVRRPRAWRNTGKERPTTE